MLATAENPSAGQGDAKISSNSEEKDSAQQNTQTEDAQNARKIAKKRKEEGLLQDISNDPFFEDMYEEDDLLSLFPPASNIGYDHGVGADLEEEIAKMAKGLGGSGDLNKIRLDIEQRSSLSLCLSEESSIQTPTQHFRR